MKLHATEFPTQDEMQAVRSGLSQYNVAQAPDLLNLPYDDFIVVVRNERNKIIGGAICEFDWGYLYFDTVWMDSTYRGKGIASRVMSAAESFAVQKGIKQAYLMTTSFQARPFYEKIGYKLYGKLDDHPKGHSFFYLHKDNLTATDTKLEVQSPPNAFDLNFLNQSLIDDISRHVPMNMMRYGVFLKDPAGHVHGGLWGHSYWNWFDLRFLWISDSVRGQGFGKKALQLLFDYCKSRGLKGIKSDTSSFQSLPFYQSRGFEVIGTLKNRPPNHESYFIKKEF